MNEEQFNNDEMELRLWEFIDGFSLPEEKSRIEKLIRDKGDWNAKYKQLLEIHQLVENSELEEPSMRFTRNVMEGIAKLHIAPATKTYINNKIIWGIGIFFITVIVGFLVYGISQINWSESQETNNSNGIDFTKVNYSVLFNNTYLNIFMMMNVILGLMLLDRFLSAKRKKFIEEA